MGTDTTASSGRSRKIRAILAGGLVLGVGAAVTLAAWNDSEFVGGDFAAGSFNLEGSVDGDTWQDHDADNVAVVFEAANNLAPEDVVYDTFQVRLDADTTSPAALSLVNVAAGEEGNEANLSYAVYADAQACDADLADTGTPLGSGSSLAVAPTGGQSVDLAIGSGDAPGDSVELCFVVTAEPGLVQSAGASAVWEFEAVSTDD